MSIEKTAEYFKETYYLPISATKIIDQINELAEKKYRYEVSLKPYVMDYLEQLKRQKSIMCVATAADYTLAKGVLKRLGILDYFKFM